MSESTRLSRHIVEHLRDAHPAASLIEREIGGGALSHIDANYAQVQHSAASLVVQAGSTACSDELIEELEASDILVLATPMHNLTVPSALKAWIDHVVRARRTFEVTAKGKIGTLRDRPVFVAVASGGRFSGERARQPDFLTPYLKAILPTIGLKDLTFFCVQGTGLGPEALAEARIHVAEELRTFFASFSLRVN